MMATVDETCILLANETLELPENRVPVLPHVKIPSGPAEEIPSLLSSNSYNNLREKAEAHLIVDYFEDVQLDFSRKTREDVVSWLVDTGLSLSLGSHTIAMAVSCFDRFLAVRRIGKESVAEVAAACLWISTKLYDGVPPLSYLSLLTGSKDENIVSMEEAILRELQWQVSSVPAEEFVPFMRSRMSRLGFEVDDKILEMLLDVSLLSFDVVRRSACIVAAACVLLGSEIQYPEMNCSMRSKMFAEILDLDHSELIEVKTVLHASFQTFIIASRK
ncbi:hypothetical protein NDN08_005792 [Rhodosorus marinus]|uniref:Cyclin-like domain-containing protein n=1 Tax=Rhodosorus marinus TaxID=101924 RepID=A0AAV8V2L4_9RHOD|nr:hypothetical protein NDN08_005792 [Rhodosorus marinus]